MIWFLYIMAEGTLSKIIQEDISDLARSLKDLLPRFEGKHFIITGSGGFLGKYMVWLLRHLNEHLLTQKSSALLLDNFVIGYERQAIVGAGIALAH
jgi:hypothetical protein